ncbi:MULTISPECIES: VTT domain-containing protein [unclassified Knoellia]|uniref:VTT domain-containing protein n=1 Tax=Knoellia altitudinis TaxID=3404795 RepID=UPI00361F42F9
MWLDSFGIAGCAVASALVPIINIEAIIALAASQDRAPGWLIVAAAAIGQMVGKLFWYYGGRELDRFAFVSRRMQRPRARAAMVRWQARTEGRPWFTAGLLLVSAVAGIPPYAVMAVVAGALRVRLPVFLLTGLVGRALRFWAVVGGMTTVQSWW